MFETFLRLIFLDMIFITILAIFCFLISFNGISAQFFPAQMVPPFVIPWQQQQQFGGPFAGFGNDFHNRPQMFLPPPQMRFFPGQFPQQQFMGGYPQQGEFFALMLIS